MDTYFHTTHKCVTCGACVEACPRGFLTLIKTVDFDGDDYTYVTGVSDYTPCHHCEGFWTDTAPCQEACSHDAIELSRW